MNPDGCVISDVWTELPPEDNYSQISTPVLHTIMRMLGFPKEPRGIIGPAEGIAFLSETKPHPEPPGRSDLREHGAVNPLSDEMLDVVLRGDALKVLRRYPDNCIDLAFADPPYNLNKAYSVYEDGSDEARYVEWCNSWLAEYARVLKPTGSLYVLNLPRWAMYHAAFLNERLCFRNWIVWDALSDPRGKLMPAHYALLHYTKHPTDFTSNYNQVLPIDSRRYCLRASCIRKRKSAGDDEKEPLTDLWWDIHRIKHRRDRDYHPCQLPDALLERIISLSSNEGDIVLDALCGAGTTPVAAAKFGRRYVAIDIDKAYVGVTKWKIEQVRTLGCVPRASTQKQKGVYTKKELQLGLRDLAAKLGRLPTPEDVSRMTDYDVDILLSMFPTWGKALKAAKLIGREVTA
jgi:site-specific DNA-methyltransferase (adenine-specific)